MIDTVISGVTGRMGSELILALHKSNKFNLTGGITSQNNEKVNLDLGVLVNEQNLGVKVSTALNYIEDVDMVIDFSEPNFSLRILNQALDRKLPILIGTTGHSTEQIKKIKDAANFLPIMLVSNTSIGIAFIKNLLSHSSNMLSVFGKQEIFEKHHINKKDSPSGTALDLSIMLKELGNQEQDVSIESLREGYSPGEHTIILNRKYETVEITHKAFNRSIFADGALLAAEWLLSQKKGLYSMLDFYLP